MKIIVIADPEMLPPELSDNPDVVIVPPDAVDEATMAALDDASGGLLGSGEGALEDWAGEEEKEPEHSGSGEDDEDGGEGRGEDDIAEGGEGRGEDDEEKGGEGRGEDEDKSGEGRRGGRGGNPFERDARQDSGSGRRAGRGRGDDEDADKGGSGRGRSPLSAWMTSLAGRR